MFSEPSQIAGLFLRFSCFGFAHPLWARGVHLLLVVHVLRPACDTTQLDSLCSWLFIHIHDLSCDNMKALAFLLRTIRSKYVGAIIFGLGATQRQNQQQPPTRQLASIQHHDVTSRWLISVLFLISSNEHHDDYHRTIIVSST